MSTLALCTTPYLMRLQHRTRAVAGTAGTATCNNFPTTAAGTCAVSAQASPDGGAYPAEPTAQVLPCSRSAEPHQRGVRQHGANLRQRGRHAAAGQQLVGLWVS